MPDQRRHLKRLVRHRGQPQRMPRGDDGGDSCRRPRRPCRFAAAAGEDSRGCGRLWRLCRWRRATRRSPRTASPTRSQTPARPRRSPQSRRGSSAGTPWKRLSSFEAVCSETSPCSCAFAQVRGPNQRDVVLLLVDGDERTSVLTVRRIQRADVAEVERLETPLWTDAP